MHSPYTRLLISLVMLIVGLMPGFTMAASKALLIGNGRYLHTNAMSNPIQDVNALATQLSQQGFQTSVHRNLDLSGMHRALDAFAQQLANNDQALFFFGGHGVEVDGQNYLIPTSARLRDEAAVSQEAISLDLILQKLSVAASSLVLIDACRNNPLIEDWNRQSAQHLGLAAIQPPAETVVIFATQAGALSIDGQGRNSPFTLALLQALPQLDAGVDTLFTDIRDNVRAITNWQQSPARYGRMQTQILALPTAAPLRKPGHSTELAVWLQAQQSGQLSAYQHYLSLYPRGRYALTAMQEMAKLQGKKKAPLPSDASSSAEGRSPKP